jgi:type IV pilus assembly protein PilC
MATATKTYKYSVRDRSGSLVSGTLEAASETLLVQRLREMGYAPVSVAETNTGLEREITLPWGNGVGLKDLAVMARQFATMINSGLSLLRSLTILSEQTRSKGLTKVLVEVAADVETGQSLSSALAKHPRVFPPLMTNMCRAGEVGGFLDTVLLQVAENFEAEVKLRSKIKSAMTYPVVILVIAVLAVVGMLLFIVPIFSTMFSDLGGTLPAPTRFLVFLSGVLKVGGPVIVLALVVAVLVWRRIRHLPKVHAVVDPLWLKPPVFGELVRKIAISRFARNLGSMIRSGVPILQALDIVAETTGNIVLERAVRDVQDSVRRGQSLAAPLSQHAVFPAMVVQMLAVGEDTGALDTMLVKISDFYDQEVEATTDALTSIIEPLMIVFVGGVVGAMIVALYMPIFSVFELVQ